MTFWLFHSSKLDDFAKSLAQDVAKRYPPVIANDPELAVSHGRITKILASVYARAGRLDRENRLSVLRRGQLGRTFRSELREMGYEDSFVEMAARELSGHLSRDTT